MNVKRGSSSCKSATSIGKTPPKALPILWYLTHFTLKEDAILQNRTLWRHPVEPQTNVQMRRIKLLCPNSCPIYTLTCQQNAAIMRDTVPNVRDTNVVMYSRWFDAELSTTLYRSGNRFPSWDATFIYEENFNPSGSTYFSQLPPSSPTMSSLHDVNTGAIVWLLDVSGTCFFRILRLRF